MMMERREGEKQRCDGFRLAGKRDNLRPMFDVLSKHIEFDPPTSLNGSVFLGVMQVDIETKWWLVEEKSGVFFTLCTAVCVVPLK